MKYKSKGTDTDEAPADRRVDIKATVKSSACCKETTLFSFNTDLTHREKSTYTHLCASSDL